MSVTIRPPRAHELDCLAGIEDGADALLRDLLDPPAWWPAPSGADRAAEPGFLLVASIGEGADDGAGDGEIVGFVHVLENRRRTSSGCSSPMSRSSALTPSAPACR